jgi:rare lipoprotein A
MITKDLSFPRKRESIIRVPRFLIEICRNDTSKYLSLFLLLGFLVSCSSTRDLSEYENISGELIESGIASWYGPNFNGRQTANGETFNMNEFTAAHRTLPFNSILRVINKSNNKSVIVRINDRGPFAKDRIIDLSKKAAEKINMIGPGSVPVELILLNNSKLPIDLKVAHYTVQVASYKRKSDAQKLASKTADSRIVEAYVNGENYYRIYVGHFEDIDKAKELKIALQRKGLFGFVKQVEN